jgi:hypothetical protein
VLGPWVNAKGLNLFTGAAIAVLVMLSIILTASVLYPEMSGETIIAVLVGGSLAALVVYLIFGGVRRPVGATVELARGVLRDTWRMPVLVVLAAAFFLVLAAISPKSNDPAALMETVGPVSGVLVGLGFVMMIFGLIGKRQREN